MGAPPTAVHLGPEGMNLPEGAFRFGLAPDQG